MFCIQSTKDGIKKIKRQQQTPKEESLNSHPHHSNQYKDHTCFLSISYLGLQLGLG